MPPAHRISRVRAVGPSWPFLLPVRLSGPSRQLVRRPPRFPRVVLDLPFTANPSRSHPAGTRTRVSRTPLRDSVLLPIELLGCRTRRETGPDRRPRSVDGGPARQTRITLQHRRLCRNLDTYVSDRTRPVLPMCPEQDPLKPGEITSSLADDHAMAPGVRPTDVVTPMTRTAVASMRPPQGVTPGENLEVALHSDPSVGHV